MTKKYTLLTYIYIVNASSSHSLTHTDKHMFVSLKMVEKRNEKEEKKKLYERKSVMFL
jgi:hypothetical protein